MLAASARQHEVRVVFAEIERSASAELRERYSIGAYLTVLVFINGDESARWVNQQSRQVYRDGLDEVVVRAP